MPVAEHRKLRSAVAGIVRASGSGADEADRLADHLVDADMCGHPSHGVGVLPIYFQNLERGLLHANVRPLVVRDSGPLLVFDGGFGYGQVVAGETTEAAIARARTTAVAVCGLRNCHHMGRIGAFGDQCAGAGLLSVHFVNVVSRPMVAPFGAASARMGTNPICIALPSVLSGGQPIILDFATSAIAVGKCRVAANRGERVPPNTLIDGGGNPTADPNVMFEAPQGALLAFGGHKGYGLNLVCELLAAALLGGEDITGVADAAGRIANNMLTIVIDTAALAPESGLHRAAEAIVRYVRESPPVDADRPVLLPGEPERRAWQVAARSGVRVDDHTWTQLLDLARGLGLPGSSLEAAALS